MTAPRLRFELCPSAEAKCFTSQPKHALNFKLRMRACRLKCFLLNLEVAF